MPQPPPRLPRRPWKSLLKRTGRSVPLSHCGLKRPNDVDQSVAEGVHLPLAGVPIAVKASEGVNSWQPQRLIEAGCVPVGATSVLAKGTQWRTWGYTDRGPTCNPYFLDRSPGGSSADSAVAVAMGMVPLATGSDGAGSVRLPAAWCGVLRLKPTNGRVPARDRWSAQCCRAVDPLRS